MRTPISSTKFNGPSRTLIRFRETPVLWMHCPLAGPLIRVGRNALFHQHHDEKDTAAVQPPTPHTRQSSIRSPSDTGCKGRRNLV
jgi:hypothetical protein